MGKTFKSHHLFQCLLLVSSANAFVTRVVPSRFPLPTVSKVEERTTIWFRVEPGNAMSRLDEQDRPRRRDRFQRDM